MKPQARLERAHPGERHRDGLRTVAAFEAAKGVLVIAVGFGLAAFAGRDVERAAEQLVGHLHLNPARHYPHILIDAASSITNRQLLGLAVRCPRGS